MKKWTILGIMLCGALIALPALSEQADQPEGQPAQPAQPAKAVPTKAKAPVKARVKAAPSKAPAAPETVAQPGPSQDVEEPTAEEEAESTEEESISTLPTSVGGFVDVMREQIEAVGGSPVCDEDAGRCLYHHRGVDDQVHEIQLWYGEPSQTIYIYVNQMASATQTDAATPVLMQHLSALNRSLGIARFEWNEADGEVRLGTVMNVDTNLDRNAMRSLLRFVQEAADRYKTQISTILEDHESAASLPRPAASSAPETVSDRFGYMPAIEEELTAMGYNPTCDAERGRCTFELDSEEARNVFNITVQYDSTANTVLVTADRFLAAPTDNPRTGRLLQKVMFLNWQQLVPMFQWDSSDGRMRVAGVVNTDTNLDRRALRSVVQSVNQVSARHYRELRGMLNP